MKVRFFTWNRHARAKRMLANLKMFHHNRGDDVEWVGFRDGNIQQQIYNLDIAYVWNGEYDEITGLMEALAGAGNGTRVVRVELAWFPQTKYLYFDERGTNGNCSLHLNPLLWLEAADFELLQRARIAYREGRHLTSGGYVLVPLQLSWDTQTKWSPYRDMKEFIRATRRCFDEFGKRLIFRRHPQDNNTYADLGIGDEGNGDLKDLICGADLVYGINSTVLLEAELMGKPTVAVGKSFLSIGRNREEALAALLARQVPFDTKDFTNWMRMGRGLEFLR